MKALNYITDYRLNQLIKGKPIKGLERLQNMMNKYKEVYRNREKTLNSYITEEELLSKSIIYLHSEDFITLTSKQLNRLIELKEVSDNG